jgi:DNA modification methylase
VDGLKPKNLVGIPWRLAFALQADGWWLRQDIIWHKPNPMPESVKDRCTKAHEYIFLLTKSDRYYYDAEAVQETATESSISRWAQDVESQEGSERVPGKTNGPMKAVGGPRRKVNGGASFGKQRHASEGTGAQSRQYERPVYDKRNRRSVWTVATQPYKGAHFAVFPPKLITPCILAGCREGGTVLDPFVGTGTTLEVACTNGFRSVGIELSSAYCQQAVDRLLSVQLKVPFLFLNT